MSFEIFSELIEFCIDQTELRSFKHVSIEEKIYIFLYIVG
jgi:hypothetical protein